MMQAPASVEQQQRAAIDQMIEKRACGIVCCRVRFHPKRQGGRFVFESRSAEALEAPEIASAQVAAHRHE
jgi:hypothetical protein